MDKFDKILLCVCVGYVAITLGITYTVAHAEPPYSECPSTTAPPPEQKHSHWVYHDPAYSVIVTSDDVYTILKPSPMEILQ